MKGALHSAVPWLRAGGQSSLVRSLSTQQKTLLLTCSLKPSETLLWGADGFVELYPVQVAAWRITAGGHSALHDICISAPTGSGKTLAYALPIVQGLLR